MTETPIVVADIGGTHARFALATIARDGSISLEQPEILRTRDHAGFAEAMERFRDLRGGNLPDGVALAVAGRSDGEVIGFTNNPWVIRLSDMEHEPGISRRTVVNDFEAVGHAVARAPGDSFVRVAGPDTSLADRGTISVVGPGTGLGVAHVRRWPGGYHVQATEGGHIDFAPLDAIDHAILARLRRRYERVSVERVVSGPGIVDIYEVLAERQGRTIATCDDAEIWRRALAGDDDLAIAALDRFCCSLGSVAGDIALAQGGFGGVVLAGGLGYRLRDHLPRSGFAERFEAKGRFAGLMRSIPVKLIVHPEPGLYGAAAAFAGEHCDKERSA